MTPTQLQLKGLHLPEAISWWPPALGWWLVALAAAGTLALLYWLYKRLTRKTAVKTAQKLLLAIRQHPDWDNAQKLQELSALLRRVAISIAPNTNVASLTGDTWLHFLDQALANSAFSTGIGACLADAPYRPIALSDAEMAQLFSLCEAWLKQCARPARNTPIPQKTPL
ncbi:MAG: DUF4381 domain-containing protein [Methylovulum sp.]|nr:DUF4381 domain-containing protein [Methylovulum sp.]